VSVGARRDRVLLAWLAAGAAGYVFLPWYALREPVLALSWLHEFTSADNAPAFLQGVVHRRAWLLAPGAALLGAVVDAMLGRGRRWRPPMLLALGALGLASFFVQGFAIEQPGMGAGAVLVASALAYVLSQGLAECGYLRGDAFVAASVVGVAILVALFTFFPVAKILMHAFVGSDGGFSVADFASRAFTAKVWGLGCIASATRCGVAWNTLLLALACATACTALGLAFALIVTRTAFPFKRALRLLSVLPIITPPFVIGLGLILLFGRAGLVNHLLEWAFGIEPTRWIYGMQGILVAQIFAFTPIAFLVLIGVAEGVSPSLEEAAQTLRAGRWRTFVDVSLPLMLPGLANAFLISFIESIADFGNPILLGGNFGVLSTEIFFSVVGAQLDPGRAATLGIVLLAFALAAFFVQRAVLHGKAFTAVAGKGDAGLRTPLPDGVRRSCYALAVPWIAMTVAIYAMALAGGFVENWGRDYTPTLRHYVKAFGIESGPHGLIWAGAAWNSFWTTLTLSAVAAPLTALLGILTAYLLSRQRFPGRGVFEFATMLSFAVPGTVIGVSYILAFNVPPIEITGTALILVACNVFRNMPVGVRAGMASMAQIDRSLDEASSTLGARGSTTLRRVLLPLLKPAVIAALVYSFVRAMTTVSAVIFLISAHYEWSTTYIINRVVNGDYGVAIAYSSVLIVLMLAVIALIQRVVGERRLGRRAASAAGVGTLGASAA
jgi:iron(III) transport system permease protein